MAEGTIQRRVVAGRQHRCIGARGLGGSSVGGVDVRLREARIRLVNAEVRVEVMIAFLKVTRDIVVAVYGTRGCRGNQGRDEQAARRLGSPSRSTFSMRSGASRLV